MSLSSPPGSTDTMTKGIRAFVAQVQADPGRIAFVEGATGAA